MKDKMSSLKNVELISLIEESINTEIKYRSSLNLPKDMTFGIEIEYERCIKKIVDLYIERYYGWISKRDISLTLGGEISSPIMSDNKKYWNEIKRICTFLRKMKVVTNENAGGHIHVCAFILGDDYKKWRSFIKTYAVYENVLFRFLYGNNLSGRKNIKMYAYPTSDMIIDKIDEINASHDLGALKINMPTTYKFQALNLKKAMFYSTQNKENNTIEFRSPNATVDEIIWQNNINVLTKMLLASANGKIDEEYLDYKIKKELIPSVDKEYMYNIVCLREALEFCDTIFDDINDTKYFLKQYLKDFKTDYVLAKRK